MVRAGNLFGTTRICQSPSDPPGGRSAKISGGAQASFPGQNGQVFVASADSSAGAARDRNSCGRRTREGAKITQSAVVSSKRSCGIFYDLLPSPISDVFMLLFSSLAYYDTVRSGKMKIDKTSANSSERSDSSIRCAKSASARKLTA